MCRSSVRYVVLASYLSLIFMSVASRSEAQSIRAMNLSAPMFRAAFAFGDSILDTGNNNDLLTPAKCNFPPYGKDFIGHQATGRFSNGKVPSDFVVSKFGIKEILPAYRSPDLTNDDLLTGVCFASGGAGFDSLTTQVAAAISMPGQLELFKDYKEKLQSITDTETAATIVAKSVYFICAGNNDITNTYFGPSTRRLHYDIHTYVDMLVASESAFIEELYNLGARYILVAGLPPLGCLPSQRTLAGGLQRDCVDLYNEACQVFNNALSKEVQALQNKLSAKYIIYADIFHKLLHLIQYPSQYGFDVWTRGCCGTGKIEVTKLCNEHTPTCADDTKYLFWDSYHPTERAYDILMDQLLQQYTPLFS